MLAFGWEEEENHEKMMSECSASDLMFGLSKTEERPGKMCTGEE